VLACLDDGPWDLGESADIDDVLQPKDIFHIRDADSSQTAAILRAHAGHNMVIQGPPGTGKSQTISNLLAEFIVQGKKVLFVSEKMAALEVVKRRLDEDGVGIACLELHSNQTNKKDFLKDLEDTLKLGKPKEGQRSQSARTLRETRDHLNEYCRAVNQPMKEEPQTAPIQIFGNLARLEKSLATVERPALVGLDTSGWSFEELQRRAALLRDMEGAIDELGTARSLRTSGADFASHRTNQSRRNQLPRQRSSTPSPEAGAR